MEDEAILGSVASRLQRPGAWSIIRIKIKWIYLIDELEYKKFLKENPFRTERDIAKL